MTDLSGFYGSISYKVSKDGKNYTRTWNYLNVGGTSSIAPTAAQLQDFNDKATTLAQDFNRMTTNSWGTVSKLTLSYDDQLADGSGEGSGD